MNLNMLEDIPDPESKDSNALLDWINERIALTRETNLTPSITSTFAPIELKEIPDHPFGPESSPLWRKFFLATLVADWACYEAPVDRADFARLKYIMSSAHPFTRLWACKLPDGKTLPIGYTAWYPIPNFIYEGVLNHPSEIDDRGILLPQRFANPETTRHAYIFNFSIIKDLRHTQSSSQMLEAFLSDRPFDPDVNTLMVTVSKDGQEFAKRSNFTPSGQITVQGETETLYARQATKKNAYIHTPRVPRP